MIKEEIKMKKKYLVIGIILLILGTNNSPATSFSA